MITKHDIKIANIKYMALQGIFWAAFAALYAFATVYLLSKGLGDSVVGMVLAAANITAVISQFFLASFADKAKGSALKEIIVALGGFLAAALILLLFLHAKVLIVIVFGLSVILLQLLMPMISALSVDLSARGVPINFGATRGMGSLTYAASSSFCGFMSARYGGNAPIAIGLVCILILVFVACISKVPKEEKDASFVKEKAKPCGFLEFFSRYPRFLVMLFGAVFLFTCYNMIGTYMIRIMESVGGSSQEMGLAFSIGAALEVPTMLLFGFLVKKIRYSTLFKTAAVCLTLKVLAVTAAVSVSGVFLAQLLQPFSYAMFIPASVYYTARTISPENQVKAQSIMVSVTILGGVMGSLLGGWLLEAFDIHTMLLLCCGLSTGGTCLMLVGIEGKGRASK